MIGYDIHNVVIFGASGHAKVVIDAILEQGKYRIKGLLTPSLPNGAEFMGYPVWGDDDQFKTRMPFEGPYLAFLAMGENRIRQKVFSRLRQESPKVKFATVIHPRAVVSEHAIIGQGSLIMPGAVVNADARVGEHAIINTLAVVEHDCKVGSFTHVAPGAILGGGVEVGDFSFVGLGSKVLPGISIGAGCTLGAGAVATRNTEADTTWMGVPAKPKQSNE